jgi:hypothetical protein
LYGTNGFQDFHLVPSGNLYFWSEKLTGNGTLYWTKSTGPNQWTPAEPMPDSFQSPLDETQPWVNDEETLFCFNRRGDDANSQLLCATRSTPSEEWSAPVVMKLTGFADANNYTVWGEPSFMNDGTMFFVRFDTSAPKWEAEILMSERQSDGSFGVPQKLSFKY